MSRHQNGVGAGYPVVPTSYEVAHVVTLLVFTFLATVAVALRFWARRIQKQALALNDYLIVLGLVSSRQRKPSPFHRLIVADLCVW